MKIALKLLFLMVALIVSSACKPNDILTELPESTPTSTVTVAPSSTPVPTSTMIPTPTLPPFDPQVLLVPAWVTDFSDPILAELDGRRPDLHDEFTRLNRGWFYFIPGNRKGPFYAHLKDGTLIIKLPAENEKKDSWVYNPKLIRKNFVLSFDFQFEETQPGDTVRFQFSQAKDQSVALDLSKNLRWTFHWGAHDDWQSATGTYDYFPPKRIAVLIIMHNEECAVYLNDAPLTYLSNCRTGPVVRSSPWAVTFHMLAEPGHAAGVTIDNIKLWDLDKITGLDSSP